MGDEQVGGEFHAWKQILKREEKIGSTCTQVRTIRPGDWTVKINLDFRIPRNEDFSRYYINNQQLSDCTATAASKLYSSKPEVLNPMIRRASFVSSLQNQNQNEPGQQFPSFSLNKQESRLLRQGRDKHPNELSVPLPNKFNEIQHFNNDS
ncbi:unnamed protein product [Dovyalis caffra]|uniref:Uncharacterized protein n=1 Tax=Dovyalis caffra TaxID=77055 RepID=A0AAV1R1C9_9ROSI|nr:unnamed protein product [Dovyalis caffra]